jgi:hypothetical protein
MPKNFRGFINEAIKYIGTLASQDANNVAITGGTITGVTVGSNPFTTATNPSTNAAVTTAIVDTYGGTVIHLTTGGNAQTIGDPTVTTAGKTFTVINNDSSGANTIAVNGITIVAGKSQSWIWEGTVWSQIDLGITALPVPSNQGGTGLSTITDHGIMLGSGTGAVTPMAVLDTGAMLVGVTGADPTSVSPNITTTKKFLTETGTGAVGATPTFETIVSADLTTALTTSPAISATSFINTAYATVASAATTSAIWTAAGNIINFTGTATVTDFPDAPQAGIQRILICASAGGSIEKGTITIQGDANYTWGATDVLIVTAITTTAFFVNILKYSGLLPALAAAASDVTTGTSTSLAVTPDALAGSTIFGVKTIQIQVVAEATDVDTTSGIGQCFIPAAMNGMNLIRATAMVDTAGVTNATTIQVRNLTKHSANDALGTAISIASTGTVATPGVVDTSYDGISTNDKIKVYVTAQSTTKPKGLWVILEYQLP